MTGFKSSEFENMAWLQEFVKAKNTTLGKMPCYNTMADGDACYNAVMRLAYLNQQSDKGALELRRGKKCLTQTGWYMIQYI